MPVYFYSKNDQFGNFSNFSPHGFELDGKYWPTVEHYFQAQKFAGTGYEEHVRRAPTPQEARTRGRSREHPLRADWEDVKLDLMRRAVLRKFESHGELRDLLLSTGDEELIESSPMDYFWGCGAKGTGQNWLGRILMETRALLRNRE